MHDPKPNTLRLIKKQLWVDTINRTIDHGLEPIAALDEALAQAEREASVWRAKSHRKCRKP
jgi:hypothetical protein